MFLLVINSLILLRLISNKIIDLQIVIPESLKSYFFAIIGAEYVMRWLPIGTHEWEKFVKPEDLINFQKKNKMKLKKIDGMKFNLITDLWSLSNDKSVNYIAQFIKD